LMLFQNNQHNDYKPGAYQERMWTG